MTMMIGRVVAGVVMLWLACSAWADPLPSWRSGPVKTTITEFVETTTTPGDPNYLPESERVAVFDNDGTLWAEQPFYVQFAYAMERARNAEPGTLSEPLAKALKAGDVGAIMESGADSLIELLAVSHANLSVDEFQLDVARWLSQARHPETGLPYTRMAYQPMLELLRYLRDRRYRVYIVSGGGSDFIRAFSSELYGIPPNQVIGSLGNLEAVELDGRLVLMKRPGIAWLDDGLNKALAIERVIGQRPVLAVGNSDGDYPMLVWTTEGEGPRLGVLVHHTDKTREYAYDRDSHIGKLDKALDEVESRGWVRIDMARDWAQIYPQTP
ncbi:HAD family hydrolase [Ferrimonas balearica]|uniref:HAD family hydrolase n=1 Tax=Ferrimonas balearica TaxID=44012 RepID=UPI001C99AD0E|nr:HAD family hydrolase [Ferrimonas balearica]MBY5921520.1 haloacid dehalogenase-like hydrolase [Ferrimonas balearica]MBY5995795.1 haloacid dehalogenase-like hydrolase [Ferrimonas balearica]